MNTDQYIMNLRIAIAHLDKEREMWKFLAQMALIFALVTPISTSISLAFLPQITQSINHINEVKANASKTH